MTSLPLILATIGLTVLVATPGLASQADVDLCTNRDVEACTRLIDSGIFVGENLAIALFYRSEALEQGGDLQGAIRDLTEALRSDPGWLDPRANLARLYEASGQTELLLENYREAIAMSNDPSFYSMRGHYHERQGDFDAAAFDFSQAIRIAPNEPKYLTARGRVLLAQNKFDDAIADFDRVFTLTIINPEVSALRGEAYYWKKDYPAALTDLNRAIQYDPSLGAAYLNRARVAKALGQFDKALPDLDKALEIDPNDAAALRNRCVVRSVLGNDMAGALADCEAAIALEGRTAEHLSNRGMVRLLSGDYDAAIADFTAALFEDPENYEALQGRGIAYLRSGQDSAARQDLDASERLSPGVGQRMDYLRSATR
jgi:tetratricopeptide (TPR) repeat protein